jgi:tight adherence protein C
MIAVLLGLAAYGAARRWAPRHAVAFGIAVALIPPAGAVGVVFALAVGLWAWRDRMRADRERISVPPGDVLLLTELTGLGLSAGLAFPGSVEAAARNVGPVLASQVRATLRRSARGAAVSFEAAAGDAEILFRLAGRAADTGAPLLPAVNAYAAELRAEERAGSLAAARRLPVRLLFPLTLLILPGFLILTVGPTVLSGLRRLGV